MIPIVHLILETTPIPNNILWWALSLGACLGGNFTMIGASANIVAVGMAKRSRVDITFMEFMKFSALVTIITLLISSVYLMLYLKLSL
jgi:Na+/H+ antiporter NhaD/arsenite permease-like protein